MSGWFYCPQLCCHALVWEWSHLSSSAHLMRLVWLPQGDKVKLTLTFKGREMQFQEIGKDLFKVRAGALPGGLHSAGP